MNSNAEKNSGTAGYEALFSYGHLRSHYLSSDMSSGILFVKNFLRTDSMALLRHQLLKDCKIFTKTNNTALQKNLSPVSRQCLWELHSGIMIRTLENISQESNLLPDTHCKECKLHTHGESKFELGSWTDPHTFLEAALVLVINLNSGDAYFCTNKEVLHNISTDSPSLQITYWKNNFAASTA